MANRSVSDWYRRFDKRPFEDSIVKQPFTESPFKKSFSESLTSPFCFDRHVKTLTPSQLFFIQVLKDWFKTRRNLFVLVSGGPGSGKTHTVAKTLKWLNSEIIFMAPTARLAKKIGGQTIHSRLRLNWQKGSVLKNLEEKLVYVDDVDECLKQSEILLDEISIPNCETDIVVIDEVGMMPFWFLYRIVQKFFLENSTVLVVGMGDSCQLKPVTSQYNVFQAPFHSYFETVCIEMRESKRFTPEYKNIIDRLRSYMDDDHRDEDKIFHFVRETFPVAENLDETIVVKAKKVLAYKNSTVEACNNIYLNEIMKNNKLYKLYAYRDGRLNRERPLHLRSNCTVVLTRNGCCSESNGTCLTFMFYDRELDTAVCMDENGCRIDVERYVDGEFPLTLGFASTIHKFQGETIDENNIVFCFDKCKDLHLVYTALSRVRNMEQILTVVL